MYHMFIQLFIQLFLLKIFQDFPWNTLTSCLRSFLRISSKFFYQHHQEFMLVNLSKTFSKYAFERSFMNSCRSSIKTTSGTLFRIFLGISPINYIEIPPFISPGFSQNLSYSFFFQNFFMLVRLDQIFFPKFRLVEFFQLLLTTVHLELGQNFLQGIIRGVVQGFFPGFCPIASDISKDFFLQNPPRKIFTVFFFEFF